MTNGRPTRPAPVRQIATVHVDDPVVSRALADVVQAVASQQRDPALPLELRTGDMFYVVAGRLVRLPAGTAGQVLTMGANGLPGWV